MSGSFAPPDARLSRRALIGGLGVALGAVAVGSGGAAIAAGTAASEPLRRAVWTPLVGRTVRVRAGGVDRRARVVAIEDLGLEGSEVRALAAGREDAFALVLAVPGDPLPDEPVLVAHPVHGSVPLFFTPGRRRHVATIDRRIAA